MPTSWSRPPAPRRAATMPNVARAAANASTTRRDDSSPSAASPQATLRRSKSYKDVASAISHHEPLVPLSSEQVDDDGASSAADAAAARRSRRRASIQIIKGAIEGLQGGLKAADAEVQLTEALEQGLNVGVPDEILIEGLVVQADWADQKREAQENEKAEREAARQRLAAERAAARARRSQKPPREGSLVKLRGLSSGTGPLGCGWVDLQEHNGRIGRVVESLPPRHLISTAVLASAELRRNAEDETRLMRGTESKQVVVHTGVRASDGDQRYGVWLEVPAQCVHALG